MECPSFSLFVFTHRTYLANCNVIPIQTKSSASIDIDLSPRSLNTSAGGEISLTEYVLWASVLTVQSIAKQRDPTAQLIYVPHRRA